MKPRKCWPFVAIGLVVGACDGGAPDTGVCVPPRVGEVSWECTVAMGLDPRGCRAAACTTDTQVCVPLDKGDGWPCDDGDPCTLRDQCVAGMCLSPETVADCPKDGGPCDDGDPCTAEDHWMDGVCQGGEAKCAADPDPCREALCEPASGRCLALPRPEGSGCDDGDPCTSLDQCLDGRCQGRPVPDCNPCMGEECRETRM